MNLTISNEGGMSNVCTNGGIRYSYCVVGAINQPYIVVFKNQKHHHLFFPAG